MEDGSPEQIEKLKPFSQEEADGIQKFDLMTHITQAIDILQRQ